MNMNSYDIIGYTADAAVWCADCFEKAGYTDPGEDNEGNPTHPIFADDVGNDEYGYCDECHESLMD
jgi:hypothetical protein